MNLVPAISPKVPGSNQFKTDSQPIKRVDEQSVGLNLSVNELNEQGLLYSNGPDGQSTKDTDFTKAIEYFACAADRGSIRETYNLACLYFAGDISGNKRDPNKADIPKAIELFQRVFKNLPDKQKGKIREYIKFQIKNTDNKCEKAYLIEKLEFFKI